MPVIKAIVKRQHACPISLYSHTNNKPVTTWHTYRLILVELHSQTTRIIKMLSSVLLSVAMSMTPAESTETVDNAFAPVIVEEKTGRKILKGIKRPSRANALSDFGTLSPRFEEEKTGRKILKGIKRPS